MPLFYLFLFLFFSKVSGDDGDTDIDLSGLVDCTNASSILTLTQQCMNMYNVTIKVPDVSIFNMFSNDSSSASQFTDNMLRIFDTASWSNVCRDIDSYVKATACSNRVSRKCVPPAPFVKDMLPSADKIRKTTEYTCANLDKIDHICLRYVLVKIVDCANVSNATVTEMSKSPAVLLQDMFCASAQPLVTCGKRMMPVCGQISMQMFEASIPDTRICAVSTNTAATTVDRDHVVDCSSDQTIRKEYLQCLINNGITLIVPEQPTSDATSQYILDAMTSNENKNMCSNLKTYQQAVNCTLQVQKQCSDDAMKPTVADSQTVQDGMAKLCGHIGDFDTKCVQNAAKSACGSKRRSLTSIILRHLCDDTLATQKCLVSSVSSCSKTTVSMYKDVLLSQSPSMCLQHKPQGLTPNLIG